jgi:hypothetical protein
VSVACTGHRQLSRRGSLGGALTRRVTCCGARLGARSATARVRPSRSPGWLGCDASAGVADCLTIGLTRISVLLSGPHELGQHGECLSNTHQYQPRIACRLGAAHAWPTVGCARLVPPIRRLMTRRLQPCRQYCHRLGMKPALKRSMPSPTRPAISDRFWKGAQHIGDHESCATNPSDGSQVGGRPSPSSDRRHKPNRRAQKRGPPSAGCNDGPLGSRMMRRTGSLAALLQQPDRSCIPR